MEWGGYLITAFRMSLKNQLMIVPLKDSVLSVDIYLYRSSARLNTASESLWNFMKAIDWTIA